MSHLQPAPAASAVLGRRNALAIAVIAPIAAALAMAAATTALGAEPPATPTDPTAKPDAAATPDKPKTRVVCTRETITGTHQVTKVCRTEEVADSQHRNAQDLVNQRRGPTSPVLLDQKRLGK